jgi:prepilin-type N-terminal cleavage/methylation domain-containing protein
MIDSWTRRPHKVGGFTLLELIAVIVIVAILAAVAVPTVGSIASSRGAAAGRQLLRDLTFARQRATATGVRAWVVFDLANENWAVLAEDPSSPGRVDAVVLSDPSTGRDFTQQLGSGAFFGVAITSAAFDGAAEVGFDWLGEPLNSSETDLAANGTVTLSTGHSVTVIKGSGLATFASP